MSFSVHDIIRWAEISGQVVRTLRDARESRMGLLGWTLAGMRSTGLVLEAVRGGSASQWLSDQGYHQEDSGMGPLLLGLLEEHKGREYRFREDVINILGPGLARIRTGSGSTLWRCPKLDVSGILREGAKNLGMDIRLEAIESGHYRFAALSEPDDYIGNDPGPRYLADRIIKRNLHSILLVGATGSGKTALSRQTARILNPEGGLLRIAGVLLGDRSAAGFLQELVCALNPSALLIDDIQALMQRSYDEDTDRGNPHLLSLLEVLRGRRVFLTYMRDAGISMTARGTFMGGLGYLPGMRPGRIGETILLLPPLINARRDILRHYYGGPLPYEDEIAKATVGLTPAYLMDLAFRMKACEGKNWECELRQVRSSAPPMMKSRHSFPHVPRWQRMGLSGPPPTLNQQIHDLQRRLDQLESSKVNGEHK